MKCIPLFILLSGGLLPTGCGALPSYQLKLSAPHKDVLHLTIYLEDRAGSEVYQRIAIREVERIQRSDGRNGLPLYEVNIEFRRLDLERERLARVVVRLLEEEMASPALPQFARASSAKIETTIY